MFSRIDPATSKIQTEARPSPFWPARAISLFLAIAFGALALACSSAPLDYKGACLHMSEGKVISCYEFYGEGYATAAQGQCEYFDKPQYGLATKVLTGRCPEEGRTGHAINEFEDEGVRMDQFSYATDTEVDAGSK